MRYLNSDDIVKLGIDWPAVIDVIVSSSKALTDNDFFQPIKPYLRYKDLANRIIAMPAYLGSNVSMAGIKWIASFPDNLNQGIPRAHSVTILNHADTGVPLCTFNTTLISGIRTAAVTGAVVNKYLSTKRADKKYSVGITGFGPIGQLHLEMIDTILGDQINEIFLYDLRGVDSKLIPNHLVSKVSICDSWQEAYSDADIFMTCTVSKDRYINLKPKADSLQLNVSLRDYQPEYKQWVDFMIVDDWEEVCRENTDIEVMHKELNLQKEDTYSLDQALFNGVSQEHSEGVWMFNPMGMAIFDIGIGHYYYQLSIDKKVGTVLED